MMAFLRFAFALSLFACYSPELADCTVTCTDDTDCGGGQQCTRGRCAGEGVSCDTVSANVPDAGALPPDTAVQPDAPTPDAPPDAPPQPPTTTLRVRIEDNGRVTPSGYPVCTADDEECTYTVDAGQPITLTAVPNGNRVFERWEEACEGQPQICVVFPQAGTQTRVTAKFRKP